MCAGFPFVFFLLLVLTGCSSGPHLPQAYLGPSAYVPPPPAVVGNSKCRRYSLDISQHPIVCTIVGRSPIILNGHNTRYDTYQALEDTSDEAGQLMVPLGSLFFGVENDATGKSAAICRFLSAEQDPKTGWTLAQGVTLAAVPQGERVSIYLSFLAVPLSSGK